MRDIRVVQASIGWGGDKGTRQMGGISCGSDPDLVRPVIGGTLAGSERRVVPRWTAHTSFF